MSNKTVLLSDVVKHLQRGKLIKIDKLKERFIDTDSRYKYLKVGDFDLEGFSIDSLNNLSELSEKEYKFCIPQKEHVILISRLPSKLCTYVYLKEDVDIMLSNNILMLIVDDEKINPRYLQAYLNEKIDISATLLNEKGSFINQVDLFNLEIPIISRAKQDIIGEDYGSVCGLLAKLKKGRLDMAEKLKKIPVEHVVRDENVESAETTDVVE